jgi:ligand-binding sensor domain-containing protein
LALLAGKSIGQGGMLAMHFDQLTINEGLSHNTVFCLLQDEYGYIWMGTQNGLNKYDGYSFKIYRSGSEAPYNEGFKGKIITALFEDSGGNLWVGTRKNGVNFKSNLSDRFKNLSSEEAFNLVAGYEITSFYEDKSGKIWISSIGGGLLRYDPKSKTSRHFTQENSGLPNNITFDVAEDKFGNIWIGTSGLGISYLPRGGDRFLFINSDTSGNPNLDGYRKMFLMEDDPALDRCGRNGTL